MLIHIKPAKTAVPVRKQNGEYLADTGEKVERSSYWIRRLNEGDVIEIKAQSATKAPAKTQVKAGE